jgi:hypothetical protein
MQAVMARGRAAARDQALVAGLQRRMWRMAVKVGMYSAVRTLRGRP